MVSSSTSFGEIFVLITEYFDKGEGSHLFLSIVSMEMRLVGYNVSCKIIVDSMKETKVVRRILMFAIGFLFRRIGSFIVFSLIASNIEKIADMAFKSKGSGLYSTRKEGGNSNKFFSSSRVLRLLTSP